MAKSNAALHRRRGRPPVIDVPQSGLRVIKKYGNRRLYDTRDSRYVNLQQLLDLFAADDGLRVLDAVSGSDLTARTLTQAMVAENGRRQGSLLPPELLRALLRYRRGARRGEFERHLTRAVAVFGARVARG